MPESVIAFRDVSKSYSIYESPGDRLKELLTLQQRRYHRDYWALEEVSLDIPSGETFCIIGENGAGKSTLLQLIAGIMQPTTGEVAVNGRVSALLELGAGFNPEFTGRDNVYLNGSILGFSTAQMDDRYDSIERFAEIGEFIHQPVKTYSSGMVIRLAFAVAIHVDPDILLVDEALAVGDIYFRQRCMRKVHELREHGTTILFVSHSMPDVKTLGDRALWLDQGHVREIGATGPVVEKYLAAMTEKDSAYLGQHRRPAPKAAPGEPPPEVVRTVPNIDNRHGDARAQVIGIAVLDEAGKTTQILEPETPVVVRISVQASAPLAHPNVGFMMRNHLGVDFAGSNTLRDGCELPPMQAGDILTVDFYFRLPILYPGHFSFSPAIADGTLDNYTMCDWIDNAITLQMGHAAGPVYGFMHLPCRVEVNKRLAETTFRAEAQLG